MKIMRRIFCVALALALALCSVALADTAIANTYEAEGRSQSFSTYNNTIAQVVSEGSSAYYVLTDASGNRLTSEEYLAMSLSQGYWKVAVGDGLNNLGLIDGNGTLVMPMQYGDIEIISDKWVVGVALAEATVDMYDYKTYDGENFYLVAAYDVYFEGNLVGSLGRTEYNSASAFGDYLYVKDKENNFHYYNSAMVESGYVSEYGSSEYDSVTIDGKETLWHKGSGQQAFTEGCTLSSDEVLLDVYEIGGTFYDLQGNAIAEFNGHFDSINKFEGDYARFRLNGLYGLVDRSGNIVVPAEYDEIYSYTKMGNDTESCYFAAGYQAVVKDGKIGYVDQNGNVTCDFTYSADNARYSTNPNFATLQNLDGTYIVLSAAVGELPEHYQDVYIPNGCSTCFAAENADGQFGVVDIDGDTLLPFNDSVRYASNYEFSRDGSVIAINGVYYTLGSTAAVSTEEAASEGGSFSISGLAGALFGSKSESAEETEQGAETAETESAPSDSWTCECGSVNDGNFCPACGSKRPEEKASFCTNCGYQCEGETPNFCPQCGQKF